MRVLLLATGNMMAYKVLRCAAEAAAEVYVLGDADAARLAASRFCRKFRLCAQPLVRAAGEAAMSEINRCITDFGISMVLPGDFGTTVLLARVRSQLRCPSFPLPPADALDELNDKWSFNQLCRNLSVPVPESALLSGRDALRERLADGRRRRIIKPVDQEGCHGFIDLAKHTLEESVKLVDYEPILVQDYLPGEDICCSLYCQRGVVCGNVVYTRGENSIRFTRHAGFERDAARIASHFSYDGVLCFDGRLSPAGDVSFIECNPRFWNNMDAAMVCGANFVALGLRATESPPAVRRPEMKLGHLALSLRRLARPWSLSSADVRFLHYRFKDYPFILGMRKIRKKAN